VIHDHLGLLGGTRLRRAARCRGTILFAAVLVFALTWSVGIASAAPGPKGTVQITVPGGPLGLAQGFGSIWVSSHRDTYLYRINPATNRVQNRIDMGQNACGQITVSADRLWIDHCDTSTSTIAVDPSTDTVVGSIDAGSLSAGVGFGSIWLSSNGGAPTELLRVDPHSLAISARIPVGNGGAYITTAFGAVWVSNIDDGTISRIDPSTNTVAKTFRLGTPGDAMLVPAGGSLWSVSNGAQRLLRINPASLTVTPTSARTKMPNGTDPIVAVGKGSLWFMSTSAELDRVSVRTGKLQQRIPVIAPGAQHVLFAANSVWIAAFDADTVLRVPVQ